MLYVSDRSGIANLYVRDLETNRDAPITDLLTGVTGIIPLAPAVSLSRDGRRFVFSAFSGGAWDLFAIKDPLAVAEFREPIASAVPDPSIVQPATEAASVAPRWRRSRQWRFRSLGGSSIETLPRPPGATDTVSAPPAKATAANSVRRRLPSPRAPLPVAPPEGLWNVPGEPATPAERRPGPPTAQGPQSGPRRIRPPEAPTESGGCLCAPPRPARHDRFQD